MKRFAVCWCVLGLTAAAAQTTSTERAATVPGSPVQERRIGELRDALRALPNYGVFDDLAFDLNGATVTLRGSVTRPTLKSDAEKAVKRVEGVATVVNQIKVLPLSATDDRIRLAVYRSIYSQAGLDRYALQAIPPIHIIVENGRVILVGVVASKGDKEMAGTRANSVTGVFSVDNRLRVETPYRGPIQ